MNEECNSILELSEVLQLRHILLKTFFAHGTFICYRTETQPLRKLTITRASAIDPIIFLGVICSKGRFYVSVRGGGESIFRSRNK